MSENKSVKFVAIALLGMGFLTIPHSSTFGIEKTNVAVLILEVSGGLPESYAPVLTDRLRQELLKTEVFKVMERGEMSAILDEIGFQMTGCTSNECVVEAGQILGVEYMISGTVGKLGEMHTITLRLISVETSEIIRMETLDYIGPIEEIMTLKMGEITRKLAGIAQENVSQMGDMIGMGSIELNSIPSNAKIFLDGHETDNFTPATLKLSAGQHTIRLEKGDQAGTRQIYIVPDLKSEVEIELKTGYGFLNLDSSPVKAEIFLNNITLGRAPVKIDTILAGNYKLEIRSNGYAEHREDIKISLNQQLTKTIHLKKLASLNIVSIPSNAEVVLNDSLIGKTPLKKDYLKAGQYSLKITKDGFKDHSETFSLYLEKSLTKEIDLIQLANISITSAPGEANLYFNEILQGSTPQKLSQLSPGNYNVKLSKKKYQTLKTTIKIAEGSDKTYSFDLIPKKRSVALIMSAFIPGAGQIYGERKGIGYGILALQAVSGFMAFNYAGQHKDKVAEYNEANLIYDESTTQTEIQNAWNNMNSIYNDSESLKMMRDVFIVSAVGVYLYNIFDVYKTAHFPASVSNLQIGSNFDENYNTQQITMTINF